MHCSPPNKKSCMKPCNTVRQRDIHTHIIPSLCVVFLLHFGHPCAVLLDNSLQLLGAILLQLKLLSLKFSDGCIQLHQLLKNSLVHTCIHSI